MNIESHRAKALRIERSLAKCGANDFEIRIEGAMLAATHWVNLAYHAMRATGDAQDVMHTYMLTINEHRRLSVADRRLVDMLGEIEDIRPVYVRGDAPGAGAKADHAIDLLNHIQPSPWQPWRPGRAASRRPPTTFPSSKRRTSSEFICRERSYFTPTTT